MTKQELQEWVKQIPDDIFEKAYAIDPWGKSIQLGYSNEIIKKYFLETPISFDPNGFFEVKLPFGSLTFT